MTVALGLACEDGVVVASDSMSSSGRVARRGPKVNVIPGLRLAWTASGSQYVIEEASSALEALERDVAQDAFLEPRLAEVRAQLAGCVRDDVMRHCYESVMPGLAAPDLARPESRYPFATDFLLLGFSSETPYFLEIAADGQLNWHERFYAVGSGGEFASVAMALMEHYVQGGRLTVEDGVRLAYRTVETTIRVSAALVGQPVQMAVVDARGARVIQHGSDEMTGVEEGVAGWLQTEAESIHWRKSEETLATPPALAAVDRKSGRRD